MQQILLRQVIVAFLIRYRNFIVCNNFSLAFARHIGHFNILYRKECRQSYHRPCTKYLIYFSQIHIGNQPAQQAIGSSGCKKEQARVSLSCARSFLHPLLPLSACYAGYNVQGQQYCYCIYCIQFEFISIFTEWHALRVLLLGNLKLTIIQVPVKQSY